MANPVEENREEGTPRPGPTVVLGKDGKPCRTCNTGLAFKSWAASAKKKAVATDSTPTDSSATSISATALTTPAAPTDCPADVEELGRSTWTFLHTLAATYPDQATAPQQEEMRTFMSIFSRIYPCWACAEDFQTWMARPENKIQRYLGSRDLFGMWMCMAHNDVNKKLGKKEFDCARWKERWRDGWKDGRCD